MKAILEFDLDDPEDEMAHRRCIMSLKMAIALFEIIHNTGRWTDDIEKYREEIQAATEGINIDELIS